MDAERLERLQVDVDSRLLNVWALAWQTRLLNELDDDDRSLVAALMRAAYAVGYHDARDEIAAASASDLARANGYEEET